MPFTTPESQLSPELEAAINEKTKVFESLYHPTNRKNPTEQDYRASEMLAQTLHHRLKVENSGYDKNRLEDIGKNLADAHHAMGSDKVNDNIFRARFDAVRGTTGWINRSHGPGNRWETGLRYVVMRDAALLMEGLHRGDVSLVEASSINPSSEAMKTWLMKRNTNLNEFTKQVGQLITTGTKDEKRRMQLNFAVAFLNLVSKL